MGKSKRSSDNYFENIVKICEENLDIANAKLSDGFFYNGLSFAIIDTCHTGGLNYGQVEKVIQSYANEFSLKPFRKSRTEFPEKKDQDTVSDLIMRLDDLGLEKFGRKIKEGGILGYGLRRTQPVYDLARCLQKHGIEYFQDVEKIYADSSIQKDIVSIKHIGKILFKYFLMLCGDDYKAKVDTHLFAFFQKILPELKQSSYPGSKSEVILIEDTISKLADHFKIINLEMNMRLMDHTIWNFMKIPNNKNKYLNN